MNLLVALLRRPPVSWWDVLDILAVAVLIYEILKLIRGTRTVQMVFGGGVLAALFYGSQWARLATVGWIIRTLFGYVVFAAIVLFQSDIRRALAHFGRTPFVPVLRERRGSRRRHRGTDHGGGPAGRRPAWAPSSRRAGDWPA